MSNKCLKLKVDEYNTRQMYFIASEFLYAAKRCNEPEVKEIGWSQPFLVPIIVNLAFSCEIFIKTILRNKNLNIPKSKHELFTLFERLPVDTKNEIIGLNDHSNFYSELKSISYTFAKWRYIYEYPLPSINFGFLFEFAEKLNTHTEKMLNDKVYI